MVIGRVKPDFTYCKVTYRKKKKAHEKVFTYITFTILTQRFLDSSKEPDSK